MISEAARKRDVDRAILNIVRNPEVGYSVSQEPAHPIPYILFDYVQSQHGVASSLAALIHNHRRVRVQDEVVSLTDKERLLQIAGTIRKAEREFILSVTNDHKDSIVAFFTDARISPKPKDGASDIHLAQHEGDIWKFTISGLAPKSPNPKKSDTPYPDLGELALLIHFEELAKIAEEQYKGQKVEFLFLTEGHYAQNLLGYDPKRVDEFTRRVDYLSREIVGNTHVRLQDWYDTIIASDRYKPLFDRYVEELTGKWVRFKDTYPGDPSVWAHHLGWVNSDKAITTFASFEVNFAPELPTVYMAIPPADTTDAGIRNIYRHKTSPQTHAHIEKTMEATIRLIAFNKARKDIYKDEPFFPDHIYGSFTPGPGKHGFYAIGPDLGRYPNHGRSFIDTDGRVHIEAVEHLVSSRRGEGVRMTIE